ncbi:MAG TPA: hypothetical protein VNN80_24125, partial [Polyangiaceae bacterium]|nr:hypothetical protein [Polyangiaceae bacterium]
NLDAESNVDSIDFSFDGLAAELYRGFVQDRESNQRVDVASTSTARPALGSGDPLAHARIRSYRESAATSAEAFAHAQALTDASTEGTLGATGELDTGRYGRILEARALVDLRGAGLSFDGTWYVKQVTHKVQPGSYKQNFTLSRGEPGAATPSVEV